MLAFQVRKDIPDLQAQVMLNAINERKHEFLIETYFLCLFPITKLKSQKQ